MVSARRILAPQLDYAALRTDLVDELPSEFTPAEMAAAQEAAAITIDDRELLDIAFVTIDPEGAKDLDQAVSLERTKAGFRVHYAIADVAAFVQPGSLLDTTVRTRGQTFYFPDKRISLHPTVLSEDVASLLPEHVRPAVVWTTDVSDDGVVIQARVKRALVRSVAQYDYETVQHLTETGQLPEPLRPFPQLGEALLAQHRARGAIETRLPTQEVETEPDGHYRLVLRAPLRVEEYNAQISLLTGAVAAQMMLNGGIGLLRTLPQASPATLRAVRTCATGLGIGWPKEARPADVLARLDPNNPQHAALLNEAATLLRGAGYTAFDGGMPQDVEHAGVGVPYAHVTAPLRRLADRYATEVCIALYAGVAAPEWVRAALPTLPELMATSNQHANTVERAVLDYTEAVTLAERIGEEFNAVVLDLNNRRNHNPEDDVADVVIAELAVRGKCDGPAEPGSAIRVRLTKADPTTRRIRFAVA